MRAARHRHKNGRGGEMFMEISFSSSSLHSFFGNRGKIVQ